jgi:hypothetical protein
LRSRGVSVFGVSKDLAAEIKMKGSPRSQGSNWQRQIRGTIKPQEREIATAWEAKEW